MELDITDNLDYIGYQGTLKDAEKLLKAAEAGVKNADIRDMVTWLVNHLVGLIQLDSTVVCIADEEDLANFVMEVGSLLKELGCPYRDLTEGPLTGRLASSDQCLRLLLFLSSEILAARIARLQRISVGPVINITESSTARDLKSVMMTLRLTRPPDNISSKDLFNKIEWKLKETATKATAGLVGKPLLVGRLSQDQWALLENVQSELNEEYRLRREMILKRLDVTIQSFEWSEQAKGNRDSVCKAFAENRRQLKAEPGVALSDVIAARQDTAIIDKTSGSTARRNTTSSVHKVIIGRVPDRGGRPSEQEAPPPEMPSWQKERAQGMGGGRGGNGGSNFSRGGGNRVQGGWNQRGQEARGDGSHQQRGNENADRRRGGQRH